MVEMLDEYDESGISAQQVINEFMQDPDSMNREIFSELSNWQEEVHESYGFRLKIRQGIIEGTCDNEGDPCKIIACFFRLYPIKKGSAISEVSVNRAKELVRMYIARITMECAQKYNNALIVTFPAPIWMHE